ncbi:MAG: response regulator [Hyphomicrobiaceae bacterium]
MSRIMLIEDDAFVREDLRAELIGAGHDVDVHSGGHTALKSILSDPPNLIITDIVMEEGEGMDLISKTRDCCPDVGVIAISSNRDYLKYASALGAHHTLQKPLKPKQLLETIDTITG